MDNNFKLYSYYYDLLYKDKDYIYETDYIDRLINQYASNAKAVIELGCGTGKHAVLLSRKGYSVLGIDRSKEMIDIAALSASKSVTFNVGDITSIKTDEQFDVAISLFHVVSYLTKNEQLLQTFRNLHGQLKSHGIFIFDVWYTPAVYNFVPEVRVKRLEDSTVKIIRVAEPVIHDRHNIVDVNYELIIENLDDQKFTVTREVHPMRHFSEPEMELIALQTGFRILQVEEFLTGNEPSKSTWGVCFVLQKYN